jgi:PKD repeat protein
MMVRNAFGDGGQNFYEIDALLRFDVFSIPSSATVSSAMIHLYYYNWSGTDPVGRNLTMYFITSGWTEEFVNWNRQPSYRLEPSAYAYVPLSKGQWMTWDVTEDVQYLINARAFYGWKIADETAWKQSNLPVTYFRTKEYGDYTPYLEVTYTLSEAKTTPVAGFSLSPVDPAVDDVVQFTDASVDPDGSITGWFWNFGDGNTSTSASPSHIYTQGGQYTVTLQVTNADGMTSTITSMVTIAGAKSTPGFEFLLVGCAIALACMVVFIRKKHR